jgi:hypothetical protein
MFELGEERGNAQQKTFAAMMIKDHPQATAITICG